MFSKELHLISSGGKSQINEKILHVALSTSDPDAAYQAALAAGAAPHMAPTDITIQSAIPIPIRIAFVKGFDGELIEFFKRC